MFYFAFYKLVMAIVGHLFNDFPNYFEKLYSLLYMIIISIFLVCVQVVLTGNFSSVMRLKKKNN